MLSNGVEPVQFQRRHDGHIVRTLRTAPKAMCKHGKRVSAIRGPFSTPAFHKLYRTIPAGRVCRFRIEPYQGYQSGIQRYRNCDVGRSTGDASADDTFERRPNGGMVALRVSQLRPRRHYTGGREGRHTEAACAETGDPDPIFRDQHRRSPVAVDLVLATRNLQEVLCTLKAVWPEPKVS
jgi:hypothetical protein